MIWLLCGIMILTVFANMYNSQFVENIKQMQRTMKSMIDPWVANLPQLCHDSAKIECILDDWIGDKSKLNIWKPESAGFQSIILNVFFVNILLGGAHFFQLGFDIGGYYIINGILGFVNAGLLVGLKIIIYRQKKLEQITEYYDDLMKFMGDNSETDDI